MGDEDLHEVNIESVGEAHGWAVYTRCEGDDPQFVAFFSVRQMAELYVRACQQDSDADWWLGCEGDVQIVPAILDAEGPRILAANHYDDRVGILALARGRLNDYERGEWLQEIVPATPPDPGPSEGEE
jgi:hypothetical protein